MSNSSNQSKKNHFRDFTKKAHSSDISSSPEPKRYEDWEKEFYEKFGDSIYLHLEWTEPAVGNHKRQVEVTQRLKSFISKAYSQGYEKGVSEERARRVQDIKDQARDLRNAETSTQVPFDPWNSALDQAASKLDALAKSLSPTQKKEGK